MRWPGWRADRANHPAASHRGDQLGNGVRRGIAVLPSRRPGVPSRAPTSRCAADAPPLLIREIHARSGMCEAFSGQDCDA